MRASCRIGSVREQVVARYHVADTDCGSIMCRSEDGVEAADKAAGRRPEKAVGSPRCSGNGAGTEAMKGCVVPRKRRDGGFCSTPLETVPIYVLMRAGLCARADISHGTEMW